MDLVFRLGNQPHLGILGIQQVRPLYCSEYLSRLLIHAIPQRRVSVVTTTNVPKSCPKPLVITHVYDWDTHTFKTQEKGGNLSEVDVTLPVRIYYIVNV